MCVCVCVLALTYTQNELLCLNSCRFIPHSCSKYLYQFCIFYLMIFHLTEFNSANEYIRKRFLPDSMYKVSSFAHRYAVVLAKWRSHIYINDTEYDEHTQHSHRTTTSFIHITKCTTIWMETIRQSAIVQILIVNVLPRSLSVCVCLCARARLRRLNRMYLLLQLV